MNAPDTPTRKKPLRWAWFVVPPVVVVMLLVVFCGPLLLREVIVRRLEAQGAIVTYDTGTWHFKPSGVARWGLAVKAVEAERRQLRSNGLTEIVRGASQIDAALRVDLFGSGTLQQDLDDLAPARKLDLSLTGRELQQKTLQQLGNIPGMASLDLSGCTFDNHDLAALESLKELRFLNLDNSAINDEGLRRLKVLKNLLSVSVSNTQVSDSAKAALSHSLPEMNLSDD